MDKSFVNDITWIFNQLPVSKQMLSLSATYPDEMLRLLIRYMKNPQHIRLAKENQVLQGVKQFVLKVKYHPKPTHQTKLKMRSLLQALSTTSFTQTLVFCNYTVRAQAMCEEAERKGKADST